MPKRLIEAGAGRRIEIPPYRWAERMHERRSELIRDRSHTSFSYKTPIIKPGMTREQIVDFYEQAYSELAESFHGHLERIKELEGDARSHKQGSQHWEDQYKRMRTIAGRSGRRLWALLDLLEQRFHEGTQETEQWDQL